MAQVNVPQQQCTDQRAVAPRTGGALLGAIIGGVIGRNLGGGAGRAAATGLGAKAGSTYGMGAKAHFVVDNGRSGAATLNNMAATIVD